MAAGFLIDMDGVICRGSEPIPGADRFITMLRDQQVPFLLLTNNSQRTRRDIAMKLGRMGLPVEEAHVFTSAMAKRRCNMLMRCVLLHDGPRRMSSAKCYVAEIWS